MSSHSNKEKTLVPSKGFLLRASSLPYLSHFNHGRSFPPYLKRCMVPTMFTSASELISRWEELIGSEGSREINMWPELQNLTADVISQTVFGSNYREGMQIFQLQTEQAEPNSCQ